MNYKTVAQLIEFENKVKALWESGDLPFLIHLCGGNEAQLISIFDQINDGDYIFSTHRAHYHWLLAGGSEDELLSEIKRGRSMFLYSKRLKFIASAIVAGTCGIAAGVAFGIKRKGGANKVWCFCGDGAEDQGHFYEAVRWVDGMRLPCVFIIEDNDRSVDSPKRLRYGKNEMLWPECVLRYKYELTYPHAGSGCAHRIQFKPTAQSL